MDEIDLSDEAMLKLAEERMCDKANEMVKRGEFPDLRTLAIDAALHAVLFRAIVKAFKERLDAPKAL